MPATSGRAAGEAQPTPARPAHPVVRQVRRLLVAVSGLVVVGVGLALVPAPGPGWLIVLGGVAIWAREFAWAHRLQQRVVRLVEAGARRARPRGRRQVAAGAAAAATLLATCLAVLWVTGAPAWLPDLVEGPLGAAVDRLRPQ